MFLKILQISQENIFAWVFLLLTFQAGNLNLPDGANRDVQLKKAFLKVVQISQKNTCVGVSF